MGDAAKNSLALFTPLLQNQYSPSYYYVGVESISVGDQLVSIPASAFQINVKGTGGVYLHSGTTITHLQLAAFTAILEELSMGPSEYDNDDFTHDSGVNLWMFVNETKLTYCLAMDSSNDFSVIDNFQQQNNLIVTDVANTQVGFLATDCSTF
ncbi:aspartic proteinase nepenthesin-2 [Physcomitrium patens]|uniref:Xylanase inhibitor C-terminal domain-containing protein n=1 Tax=Physcomitrium patens TaxID=3218 RepID=A9S671_PHYPA|nr:aspartic proteinase nepenthesin-2-like [Physcomitrium patens]PNR46317.1 hypothetical protein PHYPA_013436 [Physcomitrium patens]|eukprot:XP_024387005.1 aspartic proteinase nepenthesin-2-like [Physcomitrella patens]